MLRKVLANLTGLRLLRWTVFVGGLVLAAGIVFAGPLTPGHNIIEAYKAGHPEEGRKIAWQMLEKDFTRVERDGMLSDRLLGLAGVVRATRLVIYWEKERVAASGNLDDETARKVVPPFLEKADRAHELLEPLIAKATLKKREQDWLKYIQQSRTDMVKDWIALNPREEREAIYKRYQKLLEPQGIRFEDVAKLSVKQEPTKQELLLADAKANIEPIRKALDAFFQALYGEDAKALKETMPSNTTLEQAQKIIVRVQEAHKSRKLNKTISIDLAKAKVEPHHVVGYRGREDEVSIDITGATTTDLIDGKPTVVEFRGFSMIVRKEGTRWVVCD